MTCPGCGTAYAFSEQLIGRSARCRQCNQSLTVAAVPAGEPELPRRPRKKGRRRERDAANLGWKLAIGAGVLLTLLVIGGLTALFMFSKGGGDRGPRLVGKWKGSRDIRQDVRAGVREVTQDKAPAAAQDIAGGLLQRVFDEAAGVTIDFKKSGRAFFSGNTAAIGLPPDSEGPYEILQRDEDMLLVRLGPDGAAFEARLSFRDRDTFVLTRPDRKDQAPIVFSRVKD
jgi:hypothetical protein